MNEKGLKKKKEKGKCRGNREKDKMNQTESEKGKKDDK